MIDVTNKNFTGFYKKNNILIICLKMTNDGERTWWENFGLFLYEIEPKLRRSCKT